MSAPTTLAPSEAVTPDALEAEAHEKIAEGHALLARARRMRAEPEADAWLPLPRAAESIGARPRVLRDAAARAELVLEGPRSARVVRRSELARWLASHRRAASPVATPSGADERAESRGSIVRAAERFGRRAG